MKFTPYKTKQIHKHQNPAHNGCVVVLCYNHAFIFVKTMRILIIGAGKLGLGLAHTLKQNHKLTVVSKHPKVADGFVHTCLDAHDLNEQSFVSEFDWVYVILSPYERTKQAYYDTCIDSIFPIVRSLKGSPTLVYVSSTQVYGENDGQWLNDDSLAIPSSDFGKLLKAAELIWQSLSDKLIIIRPSGLIDDSVLTAGHFLESAKALTHDDPKLRPHWLNLIPRSQVIHILAQLPSLQAPADSYILSTNPIMCHDWLNLLRRHHNLPALVPQTDSTQNATGKRLSATRMHHTFGSLSLEDWLNRLEK